MATIYDIPDEIVCMFIVDYLTALAFRSTCNRFMRAVRDVSPLLLTTLREEYLCARTKLETWKLSKSIRTLRKIRIAKWTEVKTMAALRTLRVRPILVVDNSKVHRYLAVNTQLAMLQGISYTSRFTSKCIRSDPTAFLNNLEVVPQISDADVGYDVQLSRLPVTSLVVKKDGKMVWSDFYPHDDPFLAMRHALDLHDIFGFDEVSTTITRKDFMRNNAGINNRFEFDMFNCRHVAHIYRTVSLILVLNPGTSTYFAQRAIDKYNRELRMIHISQCS